MVSKGMRITFIANGSDLFGANRSLLRLASHLAGIGNSVNVIVPRAGPLLPLLRESGVEARILPQLAVLSSHVLKNPFLGVPIILWRYTVSTITLLRWWHREPPDVVHTNTGIILAGTLATRIMRIPHIWHIREFVSARTSAWPLYQWFVTGLSDRIVCNSMAVANQFHESIRKRKVTVIYNGIPSTEIPPADAAITAAFKRAHGLGQGPIIGIFGWINLDQKGHDTLIRAVADLKRSLPGIQVLIAGETYPGNEAHMVRLKELIHDLRLKESVVFAGTVKEIWTAYRAIHICVLPAKLPEGLGNALIEAMACGCPVVGAAIGGIPEIFENGVSGLTFAPGDHKSLAAALNELLSESELLEQFGIAARCRFEQLFAFETSISQIMSLYASLLPPNPIAETTCRQV